MRVALDLNFAFLCGRGFGHSALHLARALLRRAEEAGDDLLFYCGAFPRPDQEEIVVGLGGRGRFRFL